MKKNFRDRRQTDANATLVNLGTFIHKCGQLFVLKLVTDGIPFPNAFVFDKNKKQIGKVEEIFGPQTDVYVAISLEKESNEFFIYSNKLIPKNRFLERSETEKKKEAEDKKIKRKETVCKNREERKDSKNNGFRKQSDKKFRGDRKSYTKKFGGGNKFRSRK